MAVGQSAESSRQQVGFEAVGLQYRNLAEKGGDLKKMVVKMSRPANGNKCANVHLAQG